MFPCPVMLLGTPTPQAPTDSMLNIYNVNGFLSADTVFTDNTAFPANTLLGRQPSFPDRLGRAGRLTAQKRLLFPCLASPGITF